MKKISYLLLITLLTTFISQAQVKNEQFEVDYGKLFERKATPDVQNIFKVGDDYVVVRKEAIKGPGGYRYFVELYNEDLSFENEIQLKNSNEKKEFRVETVFKVQDDIAVLYSVVDKKADKVFFFVDRIQGETLEPKRMDLFSFSREHYQEYHRIEIESSPNDEYFLLTYIEGLYQGTIQFVLFYDSDFKMISNLSQAIKNYDKQISLFQTLLGNDGNVYFVVKEKQEGKVMFDGVQQEYGDFLILILDGDQFTRVEMEIGNLHLSRVELRNTPNGGVKGAAIYDYCGADRSDVTLAGWGKGVFTFEVDKERGDLSYSSGHPFSVDMVMDYRSEDEQKSLSKIYKANKLKEIGLQVAAGEEVDRTEDFDVSDPMETKNYVGIYRPVIRDVVIDEEDNVYVIYQEFAFGSYYVKSHLFCSKFDAKGKHVWDSKIPYARNGSDFYPVLRANGGVAILFSNHGDNLKGKVSGPFTEYASWDHLGIGTFSGPTADAGSLIDFSSKKGFIAHDYDFPVINNGKEVLIITMTKEDGFQLTRIREK
ncbi:hypothetical protein KFE98_14165 [bacterium SCSIO 12741]|nr:hypothetical protein KFE98_14165 [bacterium SCSIO 12741]